MHMTRALLAGAMAATLMCVTIPASAETIIVRSSTCSNEAATITIDFGIDDSVGKYGRLMFAQGTGDGEFTDDPAMTVRIRDNQHRLVAKKRTTDGSLSLVFHRRVGGFEWTAQAIIKNTAAGPCAAPPVRLAV